MSLLANVLNSNGQIDFCRSGLGFLDSLILPLKRSTKNMATPIIRSHDRGSWSLIQQS